MNAVLFSGDAEKLSAMEAWGKKYDLDVIPAGETPLWKWLWPEECHPAVFDKALKAGKLLSYTHDHEEGRHARFTWGFYLWRTPLWLRVMPLMRNAAERVYYAHAGHQKFGPGPYLIPSRKGFGTWNPSPSIYAAADGIADYRYLSTLEAVIAASSADDPAAREAAAYLETLRERISPDLGDYYFKRRRNFNHVGRWALREAVWRGERYDAERWEIARRIMAVGKMKSSLEDPPLARSDVSLVYYHETFGPRFDGDETYFRQNLNLKEDASSLGPILSLETLPVLTNRPLVSLLSYLGDGPQPRRWVWILRGEDGTEIARKAVKTVPPIKTRWLFNLAGVSPGRYTLELLADDTWPAKGAVSYPRTFVEITVVKGF